MKFNQSGYTTILIMLMRLAISGNLSLRHITCIIQRIVQYLPRILMVLIFFKCLTLSPSAHWLQRAYCPSGVKMAKL